MIFLSVLKGEFIVVLKIFLNHFDFVKLIFLKIFLNINYFYLFYNKLKIVKPVSTYSF